MLDRGVTFFLLKNERSPINSGFLSCGGRIRARPKGTLRSAKNCDREHVKDSAKHEKPVDDWLLELRRQELKKPVLPPFIGAFDIAEYVGFYNIIHSFVLLLSEFEHIVKPLAQFVFNLF